MDGVEELLRNDGLVVTLQYPALVAKAADVKGIGEEVLEGVGGEVPALAGAETLGVEATSDFPVTGAGRAGLEGLMHSPRLLRDGDRRRAGLRRAVGPRQRARRAALLSLEALYLADVEAQLLGEVLGEGTHQGQKEPALRGGEVGVLLLTAHEPEIGLPEYLEGLTLGQDVARPAVDAVHDDNVELPSGSVVEQAPQFWPLLDFV
ncbi:MAG TPA: hypothetical protein VNN10_13040 [Dehalococcoidia bacterium]|nr:hypothetical protein [Dehalococcoidia bacterium]